MRGGVKGSGSSPGLDHPLAMAYVSAEDGPLVPGLFPEATGRL